MRKAVFIANLVLVVFSVAGSVTIYFGLIGMFILGIFQPLCAIIYSTQWKKLKPKSKQHLRNYLMLLALSAAIILCLCIANEMHWSIHIGHEEIWLTLGILCCAAMAIYFTYICRLLMTEKKSEFRAVDANILDADLIDNP